ncbi:MAG: putative 3-methyladenine DNA glycosylase [Nitrosopumilales archaeon]|nr:MAG: putative 3-methyladenine DNA glycosylase [Nitrosopumilales archaeon]
MESKDEIVKTIPRTFYERDTVKVARDLLGKKLIRTIGKQTISGIITETEAYRYADDPASHAYRGLTPRNRAMFEQVGKAYVYFTYGMYFCFNVVARNHNFAAGAVLIRGLKPEKGIDVMKKNRKTNKISNLANGPAKLTQALNINKKQYGVDLAKKTELYITSGLDKKKKIFASKRIGIKNGLHKLWNFKISI